MHVVEESFFTNVSTDFRMVSIEPYRYNTNPWDALLWKRAKTGGPWDRGICKNTLGLFGAFFQTYKTNMFCMFRGTRRKNINK